MALRGLEIRRAAIARLRLIEAPAPPATPFDGLSRAIRVWGFVSCRLEPPRSPLWVYIQLSNQKIWVTGGDLRDRKSAVLCPRRSLVTRLPRANRRSSAAAQTPYEHFKPRSPLERGLGAVGKGVGACSQTEICVRVLGAYSSPSRDHQHSCTQPGGWRRGYDITPQQTAL